MAEDIQSNIKVNIDTSNALASIKTLQTQISAFHTQMAKSGAQATAEAKNLQQNLINSLNASGKFAATMNNVSSTTEQFTTALEKNKFSIGEYFRYAGGASKSFGKYFKTELETVNKVARERVKDLQSQYISLGRNANGALQAIKVRPLMLDLNNLSTKTQIAAQKQQLLNQLLKQGSTNLLNFGKNTQWAGRQLMVGFTIPLTMFAAKASQAYMQMEQAAVQFKRVYGDSMTTTSEANQALKQVQALALEYTKYGVAVKDTMDMAAQAAAMGKKGADLLAQVGQASKLSALGGVDQQKSLQTTISLTNAFGISSKDLAKNIDFLNAVENQTVLSIDDMTTAIPKAAPVVRQLGGNVKDLAFFLTAMKEGGINASEGANALKSGLASMINPTSKAKAMLQGFGINITDIVTKDKGNLKKTVLDFASALDQLDPLNRAKAIEQMFGKFQFSRISTLFKNVADQNSQASKVMDLANKSPQQLAYISQKELEQIQNSTMYKFNAMVQKLQQSLVPIGEQFLKIATPIMDVINKILGAFNNLPDSVKNFGVILVTAVAGIGPVLLMTVGLIANGVANLIKMFANLKSFLNKTGKSSLDLGSQTEYMTKEQLNAAAVGASLEQVHQKLQQRFTAEAESVDILTAAYERSIAAQRVFQGPINTAGGTKRKGYATGGIIRGPGTGTSDSIPAMLSAGEAVIPAHSVARHTDIVKSLISGNLPGYASGGIVSLGMPAMNVEQLMKRIARQNQLEEITQEVFNSPLGRVKPTDFGEQVAMTTGHSFPSSSVGGVYRKPDGTMVFVKPMTSEKAALAEMRGTQIARDVHGLIAPKQTLRVMQNPNDPSGHNRFFVLESPLDPRIASPGSNFTKQDFFKQFVASLLRGDKDLGPGNLGGNVLADVGTAGVFSQASGMKSEYSGTMPSMEEQAMVNLLGVKGGAKKFFAQATSSIARSMSPSEYHAGIINEINNILPKLESTIGSMGLSKQEMPHYQAMIERLRAGKNVDWSNFQGIHAAVPGLATGGVFNGPGTGTSDSILARVSNGEAIIPANSVARHPELVKSLISGNIPGFKAGKFGDTPEYEQHFPGITDITTGSQSQNVEMLKVLKRIVDTTYEIAGRNGTAGSATGVNAAHGNPKIDLTPEAARVLGQKMVDSGNNGTVAQGLLRAKKPVGTYSNLVFPVPRSANNGDISGKDFSKWVSQDSARFVSMIAKNAKMDPNDPGFQEFSKRVSKALAAAGSAAISDSDFEKIVAKSISEQSEGAAKQALINARDTYQTFNVESSSSGRSRREASNTGIGMGPNLELLTNTGTNSYRRVQQWMSTKGTQLWQKYSEEANTFTKDVVFGMIKDIKNNVVSGVKKAAKIASPSKEADAVGQNIGKSAIDGMKKQVVKAKIAGEQLGIAASSGISQATLLGRNYIPGTLAMDSQGGYGILQGPSAGPKQNFMSRITPNFSMSNMRNNLTKSGVGLGAKISTMGRGGGMAGMGVSMALGTLGSIMPSGPVQDLTNGVAGLSTLMSPLLFAMPGLSTSIGSAVAALAPFAPELLVATAAIGGIAYGIDSYTKAQNKAASELNGIADIANYSKSELKSLGDYFHYVANVNRTYGGTSIGSKTSAPSRVKSAEDFLGSQAFQTLYNTPTEGKGSLTRVEQIKRSKDKTSAFARITNAILGSGGTTQDAQRAIDSIQLALYGKVNKYNFSTKNYALNSNKGAANYNTLLANQLTASSKAMSSDSNQLTLEQSRASVQKMLDDAKNRLKTAKTQEQKNSANTAIAAASQSLAAIKDAQTTGKDWLSSTLGAKGTAANKAAAAAVRDAMTQSVDQFNVGTLSAAQFNKQMDAIGNNLKKIKSVNAIQMLTTQISALPLATQKVVNKVGTLNDKLLLIKASMLNMDHLSEQQTNALIAGESPNATAAQKKAAKAVTDAIQSFIDDAEKTTVNDIKVQNSTPKTAADIRAAKQDRLNAALSLLSKTEQKINDKYDARLKKLDEIQKANDKITQQQQGQLDLADALSRGDMSAAANARSNIQSLNAQNAADAQRAAIEASRQSALSNTYIVLNGKKYKRSDIQARLDYLDQQSTLTTLGKRDFSGYQTISNNATGGHIIGPGTGTSDSIPARLSNGEYVVRANAVKAIGVGTLDKLNQADRIGFKNGGYNGYADGGMVSPLDADNNVLSMLAMANRKTGTNPRYVLGGGRGNQTEYVPSGNQIFLSNKRNTLSDLNHEFGHGIDYNLLLNRKDISSNNPIFKPMVGTSIAMPNYDWNGKGLKKIIKFKDFAEEVRAEIWAGALTRLTGKKFNKLKIDNSGVPSKLSGDPLRDSFWSPVYHSDETYVPGNNDPHANTDVNRYLENAGYSDPVGFMKMLGLNVPKSFRKFKPIKGYPQFKGNPRLAPIDLMPYTSKLSKKYPGQGTKDLAKFANGGLVGYADGGFMNTTGYNKGHAKQHSQEAILELSPTDPSAPWNKGGWAQNGNDPVQRKAYWQQWGYKPSYLKKGDPSSADLMGVAKTGAYFIPGISELTNVGDALTAAQSGDIPSAIISGGFAALPFGGNPKLLTKLLLGGSILNSLGNQDFSGAGVNAGLSLLPAGLRKLGGVFGKVSSAVQNAKVFKNIRDYITLFNAQIMARKATKGKSSLQNMVFSNDYVPPAPGTKPTYLKQYEGLENHFKDMFSNVNLGKEFEATTSLTKLERHDASKTFMMGLGGDFYKNVIEEGLLKKKYGGNYRASIKSSTKDPMSAHVGLIQLDDSFQGKGIAKNFTIQAQAILKKLGVQRISMTAGLTDGGYAWAKAGFKFSDQGTVLSRLGDAKRYLPENKQINTLLNKMTTLKPTDKGYPSPKDFFKIKGKISHDQFDYFMKLQEEKHNAEFDENFEPFVPSKYSSKIGDLIMRGSTWEGYKDIRRPSMIAPVGKALVKFGSLSSDMFGKLKSKFKPFVRTDEEIDGMKYPTFAIKGRRFAFQRFKEDLSNLQNLGVTPISMTNKVRTRSVPDRYNWEGVPRRTEPKPVDFIPPSERISAPGPIGLLKTALELKPNNKKLSTMLTNFESMKIGRKETRLLDDMTASMYFGKKDAGQVDGLAMTLSGLTGNKIAKIMLRSSRSKLYKYTKDEQASAWQKTKDDWSDKVHDYLHETTPSNPSEITAIHSTKYPVNRNKKGKLELYPHGHYPSIHGRTSLHFTLEDVVKSHFFGKWNPDETKIITPLSSIMKRKGKPSGFLTNDTWFDFNPGEKLNLDNAAVIRPYTNRKDYIKELSNRGLLTKDMIENSSKIPLIMDDLKTKEVLHLTNNFNTVEKARIFKEILGRNYVNKKALDEKFPDQESVNRVLEIEAIQRAKKMVGIDTQHSPHNEHGVYGNNLDKITSFAKLLNLKPRQHKGSYEEFLENPYREKPNIFGNIQAQRFARLKGMFDSEIKRIYEDNNNHFAYGGLVQPKYFAKGGHVRGTDTIPAMLTPGEFVVKKSAVDRIGTSKLNNINNGNSLGDSVYNNTYAINVNVSSMSNPNDIAHAVIRQIKQIDNQRVRGNRI